MRPMNKINVTVWNDDAPETTIDWCPASNVLSVHRQAPGAVASERRVSVKYVPAAPADAWYAKAEVTIVQAERKRLADAVRCRANAHAAGHTVSDTLHNLAADIEAGDL